ncbi:ankyrin-1-like [Papaver somniferum]|nr:ankyrin-1-like [Papaver somniferum]XP_026382311.1 ankyrin-1-like [Papaver somniferum]
MILELLLDNGANLTQTPLPYAALLGQVAAVGVLLKWGLDPDGGPNSISPLVAAIISNSVDIVNMLLEAKACPDKQSRGFVPLTFAAHYGLTNIVKSLVKANANTSVTDKDKMTALEIAAAAGNREMVKDLLPVTDLISKYPDCWTTDGLINLFDSVEDYDAGV